MKEECREPEERTDPRDPKANLDQEEKPDPWELQERRGNLVFLDCPDILEDKDLRAPPVSMDSLEPTGRKEQGELVASKAQEDNVDQRGPEVVAEPEDLQENRDKRATQRTTDHPARLERGDPTDLRDPSASRDPKDQTARQGKMDCPDILDREERLVSKERRDPQDLVESSGHRVPQERLVPVEREDTQEPQVPPVSRVCLELLAKREERETQVQRASLAKSDPRGSAASKEPGVFPEPWVRPV